MRDVVVIGSGHNALVAACYLARAGLDVEVIERDEVIGGAVSTVERWPGVHVDRGSSLHVMIRHTGIVEDLDLAACGLDYVDVVPWAVSWHGDRALRFAVSLDETCASIADVCGNETADVYASFVREWSPRMDALLSAFHRPPTAGALGRAFLPLGRAGASVAHEFLQPADALLDATFGDERLKSALAWWATQAGPPPHEPGTAPMLATAVLMHRRAPGRPRGGSGMLTAALARRLGLYGGALRTGDAVISLQRQGNSWSVLTASGDRIAARRVMSGCHIAMLLDLLGDTAGRKKLRIGPGMGMVLRVLTDRLPPYSVEVDGAHRGMQLLAPTRDVLRSAYGDFLRGDAPSDPPLLVMTPTATDSSLAPEGRHVVTVWTQWHPRNLRDGASWDDVRKRETDRLVEGVDRYAPGFAASVIDTLLQTPADLERELGLHNGNVMHLEMSLDAMFALRPLPGWSSYRSPLPGLYLCGASTHPGGGVSGASGRSAARVLLRDVRRGWWRR
ncbi:MAG: NAD(P)/FAD-dependent oxidoreductase [Frankiales bacterium]|nr:NAD(P)/FAD-dependent oxidoreductase [Frankiales bacterium]